MNTFTKQCLAAAFCFFIAPTLFAQQSKPPAPAPSATSTSPSPIQKSVEAYLRNLYAFAPDVQVTVGPLKESSVPGIHFQDYRELQGYDMPEWSHMTRASAERYTGALYRIIERDHAPPDGTRW